MRKSTIIIADDHDLFREGIVSLLSGQTDLEVVGQARDGLEVLTLVRDLHPDLTVMDVTMPVCDGLEATQLIHERFPEARILILTVHEEETKLFEAIRAGACGYLLKSVDSAGFLQGVRGALRGEAYLPPRLAASLLEEFTRLGKVSLPDESGEPVPDLTHREQQVLNFIAAHATDKEIAAQLSISIHTVKTHVRNILGKLHASNRRQAGSLAAKRGWITNPKYNNR